MQLRRKARILAAFVLTTGVAACGFSGVASRSFETGPAEEDASVVDARRDAATTPVDGSADADAFPLDAPFEEDAPPADAAPTTSVGTTQVAPNSLAVDRVKASDGAIMTDGQMDGVIDVEVEGPAKALTLIRTNAAGVPAFSQQWDTWVGTDVIPAALGSTFTVGSSTYQAGVYEGATLLNSASGRLTLAAGHHELHIAGANVGSFVAGTYLRVVLEAPDGTLVRGPVIAY